MSTKLTKYDQGSKQYYELCHLPMNQSTSIDENIYQIAEHNFICMPHLLYVI